MLRADLQASQGDQRRSLIKAVDVADRTGIAKRPGQCLQCSAGQLTAAWRSGCTFPPHCCAVADSASVPESAACANHSCIWLPGDQSLGSPFFDSQQVQKQDSLGLRCPDGWLGLSPELSQ